jgi:hypothetical protein
LVTSPQIGPLYSRIGVIHARKDRAKGGRATQVHDPRFEIVVGRAQQVRVRTTTCFGFSRPSSKVSLKASTIIRMR